MKFLLELYNDNKTIINLTIIISIYLYIYFRLSWSYISQYIIQNWATLKNNPLIASLAGLFGIGEENLNTLQQSVNSFTGFSSSLINKFIGFFIKPFVYFLKIINMVISSIKDTIDKFRNMAQIIRDLFRITVEKTVERIQNSMAAVRYFQEKFKLIIKKQAALFAMFKQFSTSLRYIMYSFSNGPIPKMAQFMVLYIVLAIIFMIFCLLCMIGGPFVKMVTCPICLICFDENTNIVTPNETVNKIKDVNVGDIISLGGKVFGKIWAKAGNSEMFNYNGTIVSGSHLVMEENKYKRVEDSKEAESINYSSEKILQCLITENNLIAADKNLFSDYQETNNSTVNNIINLNIQKYLNDGSDISTKADIDHVYYWGFAENTIINGKKIQEYKIGETINGSIINGIVELDGNDINLFVYKEVLVSGTQLVFENNKWIRVHQSSIAKKTNYISNRVYHLITNDNLVKINTILFRDFCETNDEPINGWIDTLVTNYKNVNI